MNEMEHDRKSAPEGRPTPAMLPGATREGAREEVNRPDAPEAFGSGRNPRAPEAFGRGRPVEKPKRKAGEPPPDEKEKDERDDENDPDEQQAEGKEKREDEKKDEGPKKPPFYKRPVLMTILIVSVLVIVIVAILVWLHMRQFETTDDAFIDGHVVQISPKVAEIVKAVHVDDNWHVKKGDVLIELDRRDFETALDVARAGEASARGKLAQSQRQLDVAKARVGEADAQVKVAQTNAENANRDYQRFLALDERARSQQQLDNATAGQRATAAQVEQAKANTAAANAQVADAEQAIKTAQADVVKAQADTHKAELQLSYCTVVAPVEGLITRKQVEPGQYVQVDQPMFAIVPTDVWVTANYKETQLDRMRIGQPVEIKVDAYRGRTFHGKVDSIQNGTGQRFALLPAENATGNYVKVVQRVPVKITFDPGETRDADRLLAPGLSVEPKVRVR